MTHHDTKMCHFIKLCNTLVEHNKMGRRMNNVFQDFKYLIQQLYAHKTTASVAVRLRYWTVTQRSRPRLQWLIYLFSFQSLITFVNKHLTKVNLEVTDLDTQFHDGVYLCLLMGLLEGFFVPLYDFYLTPQDFDQKVHNVSFVFELMQDVGLAKPKARPEGKLFIKFL